MERQGQVFFLHNRVETIERMRDRIAELCPGARVDIGHGQMDEDDLEEVMARFVAGEIDVLVCTTIIESGLDIPNANTIIIDRADRFGLADLYQLRGRVGRAETQGLRLSPAPARDDDGGGGAQTDQRHQAVHLARSRLQNRHARPRDPRRRQSFSAPPQSGHIVQIGFDLYCQLLKQAVAQLKGEKFKPRLEVELRLDFVATNQAEFLETDAGRRLPAFLPAGFVSDTTLRIQAYRGLAEVTTREQLDRLRKGWRDRFGRFPAAVDNLLLLAEIRLAATKAAVSRVEVRERKLMLTRHGHFILVGGKFPRLVAETLEQHLSEVLALIKKL